MLSSIQLALAGNDARNGGFIDQIFNPGDLDRIEKAAWIALKSWRDDAELRALNSRLDRFVRHRLEDLSVSLVTAHADERHRVFSI